MLDTAEHDTAVQTRPPVEPQAGRPIEHPTDRPPVQEAPIPFEVPPVPQTDNDAWLKDLDAGPDMGRPLPPQAPAPVPKKRWFGRRAKAAKSVPVQAVDEPPGRAKSSMPLKPLLFISLCGIAVLAYLQYGHSLDKPQDLLGTALPSVETTGPTDPDLIMPAIDPRLGGPDALSLGVAPQPVLAPEEAFGPAVEPVAPSPQANTPEVNTAPVELLTPSPATAAPAVLATAQPAAQPVAQASVDPALDERMRRMEALMLQMSEQLAQMKAQQVAAGASDSAPAPAAAARPAAQPAPMPQAAPAATVPAPAPQRILVQAEPAKSSPPVRAAQPQRVARAQPVAKPKSVEGEGPAKPQTASPRLISVDMWNGEPSVVVASGIPGDKRMRALRPGDVVNGMALRSVDPVTRSVTFVGPNSQAVTLSMATGG